MLTEKDRCDNDTCVALSELGCPVPKYATINIHTKEKEWKMWISLYDAQKWLREEKDIHLAVYYGKGRETNRVWVCNLVMENKVRQLTYEGVLVKTFSSYEEALSEGVREAVKILKENETIHE